MGLALEDWVAGTLGPRGFAALIVAVVAGLTWRHWRARPPGDLGWGDLERESQRSRRRYVREATTRSTPPPLRPADSRITNHAIGLPATSAQPSDG